MKKIFGLMLAAALAMPMFAETDANADYSDWLPKAGDWNIVIATNPLSAVMGYDWSNVAGFSAGYMITDKMAVKASLGLDIAVWNNRGYARDDAAWFENPLSMAKVTDCRKNTKTGGTISLGAEWRLGEKHKVQGVFGAGLMYGFMYEKCKLTYGNAITEYNQVPSVTNENGVDGKPIFYGGYVTPAGSDVLNARATACYTGSPMQMIGAYGTVGIEWFVTPKMALGLNASLNLKYQFMNAYTVKYEGWSAQQSKVVEWSSVDTDADPNGRPYVDGFTFSTASLIGMGLYLSVFL